jgi:hypothetical protein
MKKISLILSLLVLFNCSTSSSDNEAITPPPAPEPPSAAVLTFPDNNKECTTGIEVNATQSSVTFTWDASANTNSYDIVLKNLDTNSSMTLSSNTNQLAITILKATPYSWFVVSRSTTTTETGLSPTWKFYNAGDGVQTYAPFPSELVAPQMGANLSGISTITLEWTGSDVDNDIIGYDVFFDTVTPPTTQIGITQIESTLNTSVTAGNIYYWRIVSIDSENNNAQSEIFEFRVD